MSTTIKANEDGAYTVNNDDLIPLVDNAGAVPKSVRPLQLYEGSKSNTEVVSQNGKSLQDAIDIINARGNPIIVSFTGTTIFSNYAIQEDNSGTSLLAYTGRRGYARIDNVTELAPLIECFISGPGIILFKEELPISYISKTIDIYFPQHSLIQFQPGELHTISADLILPSFTTLYCVDKNVCNIEIGIDTSLKIPKHANEIHFRGVKLASYNEPPALFTGQRQIEFLSGDL